jgi:hypothetical protein
MPIAKITGQGLAAMALSVALLWGCVIADSLLERRAFAERARVLHELQLLQQRYTHPEPVSVPIPGPAHQPRSFAG